jgi:hypothetical protein
VICVETGVAVAARFASVALVGAERVRRRVVTWREVVNGSLAMQGVLGVCVILASECAPGDLQVALWRITYAEG